MGRRAGGIGDVRQGSVRFLVDGFRFVAGVSAFGANASCSRRAARRRLVFASRAAVSFLMRPFATMVVLSALVCDLDARNRVCFVATERLLFSAGMQVSGAPVIDQLADAPQYYSCSRTGDENQPNARADLIGR